MTTGREPRLWSVVLTQAGGAAVTVGHVCSAVAVVTATDGIVAALGASVALRETVYASDETAAALEELTLTVGEGPGLDAAHSGEPVLFPDMAAAEAWIRWPVFAPAAAALGVLAVFALGLRIGAIRLGALTLYRRGPGRLTRTQTSDGLALADVVCLLLLNQTSPAATEPTGWIAARDVVRYPEVHQATGMITVQLGVNAETAFARLRAHAFAHNRRLRDVARDVVSRRLRFEPQVGDDYADGR
jgi:hypothetical protein